MAKKKDTPDKVKMYLMSPAKGYAYHAGAVHEVPADIAETLIEMGKAREPKKTLPKDFPFRDAFITAGYETVASIEAIDDLKTVPGIGPASQKEIINYLKDNR